MTGHRTNALWAGGSLVTRERRERHRAAALADEELLAILVGVKGMQTAAPSLRHAGPCSNWRTKARAISRGSRA